ncbi:MAG: rhomboid family intramembrane serine protease [Sorangiineae bacterium]|nr:rhomboid family intramembrane serine protease [Sorangiineae bacterium]MEB2343337.1 rhomboid family intramembrane serine protease [Deltaproteobacteria bacterium]
MSFLLDPDLALLGFVGLTWAIALLRTFALPKALRREPRAMLALVMALGGGAYLALGHGAGYAAAGAWLTVVLLPGLMVRRVARLALARRYRDAARSARVVAWLRPASGYRDTAQYYLALEALRSGHREEGLRALDELGRSSRSFASLAAAERFAAMGAWSELRAHLGASPGSVELALLPRYVRCLGECGDLTAMFAAAESEHGRLDAAAARPLRHLVWLFIFSFAGRPVRVAELFDGPLRHADGATRALWLGTAELASGEVEAGRARLLAAVDEAGPALGPTLERRVREPPALAAATLGAGELRVLERLERAWHGERRYAPDARARVRPVVTWALVGALAAMFALEILAGGSTDDATLLRLGALEPSRLGSEPWRLLTAQLLHFGPVHLGFNALGLALLGGFAERALGRVRFLVVYLLSGTLALCAYALLARLGVTAAELLVGASGNIMGIVGASAAILAQGWWAERAPVARRYLIIFASMVVLQAVVDLLVPGTSFVAHALGAAFGFVLAGPMVGMGAARVAVVGALSIVLSVAGERYSSRESRQLLACAGPELTGCEESCRGGASDACLELAARLREGVGVEADAPRALEFEELACELGSAYGCQSLDRAARDGRASEAERRFARGALGTACARGEREACRLLEELVR